MKLRRRKSVEARSVPMQLDAAYGVCRSISRAAARNFYYAFLALPREKRDAICAVYAFMRHADDISDDPGLESAEKRTRLNDWMERLNRVVSGEATDDPVLMALADAQRRYKIPMLLLEKLVAGTTMDLAEPSLGESNREARRSSAGAAEASGATLQGTGAVQVALADHPPQLAAQYETFEGLYNYCYHVASVVGLVCIRIFGYRDPAAEPLAEHCGIAFQLTNIIRDVKEDADLGRIYLPAEDLRRFEVFPGELATGEGSARVRSLLEFEAERARKFYQSASELLPLIDEDGRPALWVLVTIYRRLLEKIAAGHYDVFREKVRLSFWEKMSVLARGVWQRLV